MLLFNLLVFSCIENKFSSDDNTQQSQNSSESSVEDTDEVPLIICEELDLNPKEVSSDESCFSPPLEGTWDPVIEWSSIEPGESVGAPIVGQLTDDNGDGIINDDDIPDIVVAGINGSITVLSGDGSSIHWQLSQFNGEQGTPAIADLDGDGRTEIIVIGGDFLGAYRGDSGQVYWKNTNVRNWCGGPGVYDMNGDGMPEVVVGSRIINGQTGDVLHIGEHGNGSGGPLSIGTFGVAADIDLDGVLEVVVGNALYSPTGESIWYNGEEDGFVAVGNFDDDPYGEIVVTHAPGIVRLQDNDGSVIWSGPYMGDTIGPPTVADFDNDGEPEIGVSGKTEYLVLDTDGSILWTKSIIDHTSGYTGASVFDFEGDGKAEVVYADEQNVWVFDGATGNVKLKMEEHSSATCTEYPTIADVDGDGQTEIIYTSSEEFWFGTGHEEGVRVIGNKNDTWKPARTIWNQHSYSITNVENSSGKIPTYPDPNWSSYNNFRSGDLEAGTNSLFTDAVPLAGDVCVDECDQDILWIVFHIGNSGTTELPSGVPASLYAKQGQNWVLLDTAESTRTIAPGESDEGILFNVNKTDIPEGELRFVVDDFDGAESIIECNEENNQLHVLDVECP